MSTTLTPAPGTQLWGIYHTDREYARQMGDPLRTTVEAPTKIAAEQEAARLGFSKPWAHPIAPEVAMLLRSITKGPSYRRQEPAHSPSRGIHI